MCYLIQGNFDKKLFGKGKGYVNSMEQLYIIDSKKRHEYKTNVLILYSYEVNYFHSCNAFYTFADFVSKKLWHIKYKF